MKVRGRQRWWLKQLKDELLVDFFTKAVVRVWLMLDPTNDLSLEECGDVERGERPEWYQYERESLGWDDILDVRWNSDGTGKLRWMLDEGIAPGQPFLVELPHPHYSTSHTENGTEYDVEFNPDIIRISPMSRLKAVSDLEKEYKLVAERLRWKEERAAKHRFLVRTDVKAMFIEISHFFTGNSYRDDMASPTGLRYSLCSSASLDKRERGKWATARLAQAEGEDRDGEVIYERLVAEAMKTLPGLSAEAIHAMPRRGNW